MGYPPFFSQSLDHIVERSAKAPVEIPEPPPAPASPKTPKTVQPPIHKAMDKAAGDSMAYYGRFCETCGWMVLDVLFGWKNHILFGHPL